MAGFVYWACTFGVLIVAATSFADEGSSDFLFECFTVDGRYPDAENCSSFYECQDGIPRKRSCAAGLHFSESTKTCTLPELARCQSANSTEEDFILVLPSKGRTEKINSSFNGSIHHNSKDNKTDPEVDERKDANGLTNNSTTNFTKSINSTERLFSPGTMSPAQTANRTSGLHDLFEDYQADSFDNSEERNNSEAAHKSFEIEGSGEEESSDHKSSELVVMTAQNSTSFPDAGSMASDDRKSFATSTLAFSRNEMTRSSESNTSSIETDVMETTTEPSKPSVTSVNGVNTPHDVGDQKLTTLSYPTTFEVSQESERPTLTPEEGISGNDKVNESEIYDQREPTDVSLLSTESSAVFHEITEDETLGVNDDYDELRVPSTFGTPNVTPTREGERKHQFTSVQVDPMHTVTEVSVTVEKTGSFTELTESNNSFLLPASTTEFQESSADELEEETAVPETTDQPTSIEKTKSQEDLIEDTNELSVTELNVTSPGQSTVSIVITSIKHPNAGTTMEENFLSSSENIAIQNESSNTEKPEPREDSSDTTTRIVKSSTIEPFSEEHSTRVNGMVSYETTDQVSYTESPPQLYDINTEKQDVDDEPTSDKHDATLPLTTNEASSSTASDSSPTVAGVGEDIDHTSADNETSDGGLDELTSNMTSRNLTESSEVVTPEYVSDLSESQEKNDSGITSSIDNGRGTTRNADYSTKVSLPASVTADGAHELRVSYESGGDDVTPKAYASSVRTSPAHTVYETEKSSAYSTYTTSNPTAISAGPPISGVNNQSIEHHVTEKKPGGETSGFTSTDAGTFATDSTSKSVRSTADDNQTMSEIDTTTKLLTVSVPSGADELMESSASAEISSSSTVVDSAVDIGSTTTKFVNDETDIGTNFTPTKYAELMSTIPPRNKNVVISGQIDEDFTASEFLDQTTAREQYFSQAVYSSEGNNELISSVFTAVEGTFEPGTPSIPVVTSGIQTSLSKGVTLTMLPESSISSESFEHVAVNGSSYETYTSSGDESTNFGTKNEVDLSGDEFIDYRTISDPRSSGSPFTQSGSLARYTTAESELKRREFDHAAVTENETSKGQLNETITIESTEAEKPNTIELTSSSTSKRSTTEAVDEETSESHALKTDREDYTSSKQTVGGDGEKSTKPIRVTTDMSDDISRINSDEPSTVTSFTHTAPPVPQDTDGAGELISSRPQTTGENLQEVTEEDHTSSEEQYTFREETNKTSSIRVTERTDETSIRTTEETDKTSAVRVIEGADETSAVSVIEITDETSIEKTEETDKTSIGTTEETDKASIGTTEETDKASIGTTEETDKASIRTTEETDKTSIGTVEETDKASIGTTEETDKASIGTTEETDKASIRTTEETDKTSIGTVEETDESSAIRVTEETDETNIEVTEKPEKKYIRTTEEMDPIRATVKTQETNIFKATESTSLKAGTSVTVNSMEDDSIELQSTLEKTIGPITSDFSIISKYFIPITKQTFASSQYETDRTSSDKENIGITHQATYDSNEPEEMTNTERRTHTFIYTTHETPKAITLESSTNEDTVITSSLSYDHFGRITESPEDKQKKFFRTSVEPITSTTSYDATVSETTGSAPSSKVVFDEVSSEGVSSTTRSRLTSQELNYEKATVTPIGTFIPTFSWTFDEFDYDISLTSSSSDSLEEAISSIYSDESTDKTLSSSSKEETPQDIFTRKRVSDDAMHSTSSVSSVELYSSSSTVPNLGTFSTVTDSREQADKITVTEIFDLETNQYLDGESVSHTPVKTVSIREFETTGGSETVRGSTRSDDFDDAITTDNKVTSGYSVKKSTISAPLTSPTQFRARDEYTVNDVTTEHETDRKPFTSGTEVPTNFEVRSTQGETLDFSADNSSALETLETVSTVSNKDYFVSTDIPVTSAKTSFSPGSLEVQTDEHLDRHLENVSSTSDEVTTREPEMSQRKDEGTTITITEDSSTRDSASLESMGGGSDTVIVFVPTTSTITETTKTKYDTSYSKDLPVEISGSTSSDYFTVTGNVVSSPSTAKTLSVTDTSTSSAASEEFNVWETGLSYVSEDEISVSYNRDKTASMTSRGISEETTPTIGSSSYGIVTFSDGSRLRPSAGMTRRDGISPASVQYTHVTTIYPSSISKTTAVMTQESSADSRYSETSPPSETPSTSSSPLPAASTGTLEESEDRRNTEASVQTTKATKIHCACKKCYLPMPGTCSSYYKCKRGKLRKKECHHGKIFDFNRRKCEWPHKATCPYRTVCPQLNGLFPDPEDQRKYLRCSNGIAHREECQKGLKFEPHHRRCEWPNGITGADTDTTGSTKSPIPGCDGRFRLVADPNDEKCFYRCVARKNVRGCCSGTHVFDSSLHHCVHNRFSGSRPKDSHHKHHHHKHHHHNHHHHGR